MELQTTFRRLNCDDLPDLQQRRIALSVGIGQDTGADQLALSVFLILEILERVLTIPARNLQSRS
jgi:hypothetical protein